MTFKNQWDIPKLLEHYKNKSLLYVITWKLLQFLHVMPPDLNVVVSRLAVTSGQIGSSRDMSPKKLQRIKTLFKYESKDQLLLIAGILDEIYHNNNFSLVSAEFEALSSLSTKTLLLLYPGAILQGKFNLAYKFRREAALIASQDHNHLKRDSMSAALEEADAVNHIEATNELLKLYTDENSILRENRNIFKVFYRSVAYKMPTNMADKFREFVSGKSIALVGPAASLENIGNEIDQFDVVARVTYRGQEYLPNPNIYGKRTDISYYGWGAARTLLNHDISFFSDLSFACFEEPFGAKLPEISEITQLKILDTGVRPYSLFNGSFGMIEAATHDILTQRPKLLKVFHTNFYLSNKTYFEGYLKNTKQLKGNAAFYAFMNHDNLTSFNYLKNLKKLGLIEADKRLSEILDYSNEEFMDKLQVIYSS